jgi:hypothetical protein
MGPRAILDAVVKRKIPSSHQESNPRTLIIQPVAQHYTPQTCRGVLYLPKALNEELHNLYASQNIIRVIKFRSY